ncbi:radical SAM protein [uncultured Ilyobacter sp.]|uniref:radical SAM protein n=1 Tax=uncultured Ilyobacter sp. TaxID=544433 RepID=UPI002AA853A5|nr:hypothetical protein [uncultured Ilyobacter sp.]
MDKILLVEPAYKNKYPPIGLMKISTFHKDYRRDYVKFVKGIEELKEKKWNRIYITTLFTFDFDIVVKTINYYKNYVENPKEDIVIGGVLATLIPENLEKSTGLKPFLGQVTCATMIGYPEYKGINVDIQPLDYDILSDIDYKYPIGDSYIGYTSRGCPNKCEFCAVPTLEPEFLTTNNITNQINAINKRYGEKRNLMLMDNNILYSPYLKDIVEELKNLGFKRGEKLFQKPNYPKEILKRIMRRESISRIAYEEDIQRDTVLLIEEIKKINVRKVEQKNLENFIIDIASKEKLHDKLEFIKKNAKLLDNFYENRKRKPKMTRYVDFNQGTDARLLTKKKMSYLSKIDIRPYRIALDDIKLKDTYIKAMKIAASFGVKHFSNYILFNFKDTPEDFWDRLKLNIDLAEEIGASDLFSFPMKYIPIKQTHRKFIGKSWSKKYITNVYAILNAKKGIVPKRKDFFEKAYGKTKEEFLYLLKYPKDILVYRNYFEELGITSKWIELFDSLSKEEKELFYAYQNKKEIEPSNKVMEELFLLESIKKYKVDLIIQHSFKNKKIIFEKLYKIILEVQRKNFRKKIDLENFLKNNRFVGN